MVIHDDPWWSMMIHDDPWWSMMIHDDPLDKKKSQVVDHDIFPMCRCSYHDFATSSLCALCVILAAAYMENTFISQERSGSLVLHPGFTLTTCCTGFTARKQISDSSTSCFGACLALMDFYVEFIWNSIFLMFSLHAPQTGTCSKAVLKVPNNFSILTARLCSLKQRSRSLWRSVRFGPRRFDVHFSFLGSQRWFPLHFCSFNIYLPLEWHRWQYSSGTSSEIAKICEGWQLACLFLLPNPGFISCTGVFCAI